MPGTEAINSMVGAAPPATGGMNRISAGTHRPILFYFIAVVGEGFDFQKYIKSSYDSTPGRQTIQFKKKLDYF